MRAFSSDIFYVSSILNDPLEFTNKEESRTELNNKLEYFYDTDRKCVTLLFLR